VVPHSRPTLGPEDVEALVAVVEGGHLTQGPRVATLERALAERLERRGGVAASSGTAALALALGAMRIGPGDQVLLPAFACSALAGAVRFVGAEPVLADVGEDLAMAPAEARRRMGARTRAVVVVHPFGHPVDLGPFLELGVPVVEDCAQALGASRGGRPAGSLGEVAVCSFYATKMLAAGEGGMVLADDDGVLGEARAMRAGGAHPRAFNFKMSDLAAALALSQLARLEAFVARRREIAGRYEAALRGTAVRLPARAAGAEPCFSRFVVRVPNAGSLIAALARRGVEAKRPVADPLLSLDEEGTYPEAARAFDECVSLPLYPSLADEEIARVIGAVREAVEEAGWA
jgi:dTDP-4-amino-4,6-dideoxygalactose transaminase